MKFLLRSFIKIFAAPEPRLQTTRTFFFLYLLSFILINAAFRWNAINKVSAKLNFILKYFSMGLIFFCMIFINVSKALKSSFTAGLIIGILLTNLNIAAWIWGSRWLFKNSSSIRFSPKARLSSSTNTSKIFLKSGYNSEKIELTSE